MRLARTIAEFRTHRREAAGPVGFVPTMGYLHGGHASLVEAARNDCQTVVVSIFVNPTQFGPSEDFERYPRDEEHDLELLSRAGADLVLLPGVEEMYPPGDSTRVRLTGLTDVLEGASRPGHFDGVATVVAKLFNIVGPDRAYFGQKDGQQVLVIERMVRDLLMPIRIVRCPTVREDDGLASSSRNVYLSPEQRAQAPALYRGLQKAVRAFHEGVRDAERIRSVVGREVDAQSLAQPEYVSLADAETLAEVDGLISGEVMLSLAVRFGGTRLIDNVLLSPPDESS